MKYLLIFLCSSFMTLSSHAQQRLSGRITDPEGAPLHGASVRYLSDNRTTATGAAGVFSLLQPRIADTLVVTFVGYLSRRLPVAAGELGPLHIVLDPDPNALEEVVVNTGYYQVPKERATGSFVHVDNTLINRSVSTNILQRLEGVVSGVQFVEPQASDGSGIRIRGLSTIEADTRPLIVVDNFPYEGDINTINPNDVESITVLKDAAAASIWGARAGNGVIVINTKQGAYNRPARISVNNNVMVGEKPDLFYSQSYLPSTTVMEIQKELFGRGTYREQDQTYIPSYVELLIKQRDGLVSDAEFARQEAFMQRTDLRRDAMEYLYQPSINQQHSLGVRGGGDHYRYAFSAGYDRNRSHVVGDGNERMSLSLQNTFRVRPNLEFTGNIWFAKQKAVNNGITHQDLGLFTSSALGSTNIYDGLVNADGEPAFTYSAYRQAYRESAMASGLHDWMYRPLDEQRLNDDTNGSNEWRLNANVRYDFLKHFNLDASYQYTYGDTWSRRYLAPESYYVRDLVNQFTQPDGTLAVPYGGILEMGEPSSHDTHSGRAQLNFDTAIGDNHRLTALAGGEVRQRVLQVMPHLRIYNYDKETGTGTTNLDFEHPWISQPAYSMIPYATGTASAPNRITDRFLSYFANGSYTFKGRYTLSGSMRWDGSNLLGVKANQKGTTLWSVGGGWNISEEPRYRVGWLPYLRLRTTYGSAGNIDKSQSHYPTIAISTNTITGLMQSTLSNPGNPSLRWEQVSTFNAGIDWRIVGNRIFGAIEYYNKSARHLLGDNLMDPTAGVGLNYKMNYADLRTQGWDLQVESRNLKGRVAWNTTLLVSYTYNTVTKINVAKPTTDNRYVTNKIHEKGKSVDQIYALPWYGLNPENGYPLIFIDGQISNDYTRYNQNIRKEELVDAGVTVPPYYGSLRNLFEWNGFSAGVLLTFKAGYVFRRSSVGPGQEYLNAPIYHMDYFKRWQGPGDERHTNVPAWAETASPNPRFAVYQNSEALITRGDHIRLQDISLGYTLPARSLRRTPFASLRIYGYARNLGTLWRSNDQDIDPDYVHADYVAPRTFSMGIQMEF